jgi:hypothetical protein
MEWCTGRCCRLSNLLHTWFVREQEYIWKSLKFQDTSVHDRLHGKPVMQYNTWTLSTYQCGLWCWPKCYHVLNWFFLPKTWFLGIYLNFQQQKSLKNQYLQHCESKSYQINSIKSCLSRSFQQHQRHIRIPPKFSATILINFQWKIHSIFKNFCIASPNVMEPSPCTPPCWELSKEHNL